MVQRKTSTMIVALLGLLFLASPVRAGDVTLYAAASLTQVIKTLATRYEQNNGIHIKPSFASSSTLAKQIEAGAPADLYISADKQWMDYLQTRQLIDNSSRKNLLGNELVLIAPVARPRTVTMKRGFDLAASFTGKLCMGDPSHVPAGIYGQQALQSLGWWDALAKRVAGTEDVRTALAFVQRGECPLGVVYATDAAASRQVMIAGRFPASTHDPIIYPVALLPRASAEAREFYRYLQGDAAKAIYRQAGFVVLNP